MNRRLIFIFSFCILFSAHNASFGMDQIDIHGFISQGFIKSTGNDVLPDSTDGSFEMNELGINFTTQVNPSLRMGAQFFARDYGDYGNDQVNLDWAFADYDYKSWLGIRAGRMKVLSGLYNSSRDIASTRTFIMLPGIYMESFREMFVGMKGVGAHGYLPYGFSYLFSFGAIDNPSNYKDSFLFETLLPLTFAGSAAKMTGLSPSDFTNIRPLSVSWQNSTNIGLFWDTPLSGLRFSATYWAGRAETEMAFEMKGVPLTENVVFEEISARVVSAEYSFLSTTVAVEYMEAPFYAKGQPKRKVESYYTSITHRLNNLVELGVYYSELYPHYDDKDGSEQREGPISHLYWCKDLCYTVRFDISYNWIFKLEGHVLDGAAFVPEVYKEYSKTYSEEGPRHWEIYLAKLSYSF
ncbi:MAG: hypothetical protein KJ737_21330 [Proteobacteria bacterium]|nr:hypothetical protein [Pseudomonadota bacterium]